MRRSILACAAFCAVLVTPGVSRAFCFEDAGARYQVSPQILWSIAQWESRMNPRAVNRNKNGSVDVGLMQINSWWRSKVGQTWEYLFDPCTNVMVGAWVYRQCVEKHGNTWKAVGCYHSPTPARQADYVQKVANVYRRQFLEVKP